jgi:hypothetical protein
MTPDPTADAPSAATLFKTARREMRVLLLPCWRDIAGLLVRITGEL